MIRYLAVSPASMPVRPSIRSVTGEKLVLASLILMGSGVFATPAGAGKSSASGSVRTRPAARCSGATLASPARRAGRGCSSAPACTRTPSGATPRRPSSAPGRSTLGEPFAANGADAPPSPSCCTFRGVRTARGGEAACCPPPCAVGGERCSGTGLDAPLSSARPFCSTVPSCSAIPAAEWPISGEVVTAPRSADVCPWKPGKPRRKDGECSECCPVMSSTRLIRLACVLTVCPTPP